MLLTGKRYVVTGIASKLSIAWGIAEALHREGASLILTYPNEKMKKRVDMAAETFGAELVLACDVGSDDEIQACFDQVAAHWPDGIDGVVHAIGFAPADQLDGDFTDATTGKTGAVQRNHGLGTGLTRHHDGRSVHHATLRHLRNSKIRGRFQ